jgi:hypothetical protein
MNANTFAKLYYYYELAQKDAKTIRVHFIMLLLLLAIFNLYEVSKTRSSTKGKTAVFLSVVILIIVLCLVFMNKIPQIDTNQKLLTIFGVLFVLSFLVYHISGSNIKDLKEEEEKKAASSAQNLAIGLMLFTAIYVLPGIYLSKLGTESQQKWLDTGYFVEKP